MGREGLRVGGEEGGDGAIDLFDLIEFQSLYAAESPAADLNDDGAITVGDLALLLDRLR